MVQATVLAFFGACCALCVHAASKKTLSSPTSKTIASGELVLTDLAPRVSGYWGDSCSTIVVGDVPHHVAKAYRRVRDRLEDLVAAVRPDVTAGQIDRIGRRGLDYPHHTGHGIGTHYHEEPRIVSHAEIALAPNMVIALEPGLYTEDAGIRLEWVVLVTSDGCEVLSRHDISM
jgi:Xaa-Pro dipeptidase